MADNDFVLYLKSFSYKESYPSDSSPHGGGYVFDCRCLPNPGRDEAFRSLTGLDSAVVEYLESESEVKLFLEHATQLVEQHVKIFLERNFDYLSVCFGCTGGQHRSVYCCERMKEAIQAKYQIKVDIEHVNLKKLGFI